MPILFIALFLFQKWDKMKFVRVIGYHSLHIYVIHLAVTAGTRIFFRNVLHYDNFFVLLIVSTILGIGIPIDSGQRNRKNGYVVVVYVKESERGVKRPVPVHGPTTPVQNCS